MAEFNAYICEKCQQKGVVEIKAGPIITALTETMVKIRFFGSIRVAVEKSSDDLDLFPDTTVYGLLRELSDIYGEDLHSELFDDSGGLREDLMVTVNEAIVSHENAGEIRLNPGDTVALFPTFPGGG